ncbi:MAG TPA: hypothetical protein VF502_04085, partial [Stellaceae bacterium]
MSGLTAQPAHSVSTPAHADADGRPSTKDQNSTGAAQRRARGVQRVAFRVAVAGTVLLLGWGALCEADTS